MNKTPNLNPAVNVSSAVGLCRTSAAPDGKHAIAAQRMAIEEFFRQTNQPFSLRFLELPSNDRDGQRTRTAIDGFLAEDGVDAIVVTELSRLHRRASVQLELVNALKSRGVRLLAINDEFDTAHIDG